MREHTEPIDLVITDIVMPQMGGHELSAPLYALEPHKVLADGVTAKHERNRISLKSHWSRL